MPKAILPSDPAELRSLVAGAIAQLEADGQSPTVMRVREVLGGGSNGTLAPVIQQVRAERAAAQPAVDLPATVKALTDRLTTRLYRDLVAEARRKDNPVVDKLLAEIDLLRSEMAQLASDKEVSDIARAEAAEARGRAEARADRLNEQLERERSANLEADARAAQERQSERDAAAIRAAQEREAHQTVLAELRDEHRRSIERLQSAHARSLEMLAGERDAAASRAAEVPGLVESVGLLRAQLEERAAALEQARSQIKGLDQQLQEERHANSRSSATLDAKDEIISKLQQQAEGWSAQLREAETRLAVTVANGEQLAVLREDLRAALAANSQKRAGNE